MFIILTPSVLTWAILRLWICISACFFHWNAYFFHCVKILQSEKFFYWNSSCFCFLLPADPILFYSQQQHHTLNTPFSFTSPGHVRYSCIQKSSFEDKKFFWRIFFPAAVCGRQAEFHMQSPSKALLLVKKVKRCSFYRGKSARRENHVLSCRRRYLWCEAEGKKTFRFCFQNSGSHPSRFRKSCPVFIRLF